MFSTIEKAMKIPKEMVYKYECFSKVDQQYEIHCLVKNKCSEEEAQFTLWFLADKGNPNVKCEEEMDKPIVRTNLIQ